MDAKSPPSIRPPGFLRLPQIPMMGRNVRTAQSKTSARQTMESKVLTVGDVAPSDEVDNLNIVNLWTKTDSVAEAHDDSKDAMVTDDNVIGTAVKLDENNCNDTADIVVNKDTEIKGTPAEILISPRQLSEKRKRRSSKRFEIDAEEEKVVNNQPKKRGRKSKTKTADVVNDKLNNDQTVGQKLKRKSASGLTEMVSSVGVEENVSSDENRKIESPLEKKKSRSKLEIEAKALDQINAGFCESEPTTAEQGVGTSDDSEFLSQEEENMEVGMHIPRCVIIKPAEVPNDAKKQVMLGQQSSISDLEHPVMWNHGEMFWGKVSGHPYWPCMVSPCPFTKMMTRVRIVGKPFRVYHVQFFGDACERGWVRESSLLDFKGREDFLEQAAKVVKNVKGNNPFKINPSRHDWKTSVDEAEDAFELSVNDRIVQYTFDYLFFDKSFKKKKAAAPTTPVQRKRKKSSSASPNESKAKKRKIEGGAAALFDTPLVKKEQPDVYDFNKNESPPTYYTVAGSSPVPGKRSKKPTMKLVESILQASPGAKKVLSSPGAIRGRPRKISLPDPTVVPSSPSMASPLSQVEVSPWRKRGRPRKYPVLESVVTPSAKIEQSTEDTLVSDAASSQDSNMCPEEASTPTPSNPMKRQSSRKSSQTTKEQLTSHTTNGQTDSSSPKYTLVPEVLMARKASQDSDSSCSEISQSKPRKTKEPYELEVYKLQLTTKIEKEHICAKCENNGELIECHGSCGQYFHMTCLLSAPSNIDEFKCEECMSGIHPCFSCKIADSSTKKCSVHQCGKFYHDHCVQRLRLTRVVGDNKGFICPLHACTTCAVDNIKNIKATKGRLFRCVRCPTAYHHGDFCIAAGSQVIGGGYIVCSNHFQPNKSQSSHAHFNINWCFICNRGGALLCCESCPASYHPDCIKVEKTPDEAWFCEECRAGRRPLYGNIVWIKVGNYRWWPGEVCHPRHVPMNIQEKAHQVGEFPVRFFGSHDYYWIHKGRVFLFEEGDKASRDSSASKSLYKVYSKGVEEATEAFNHWKTVMERKEEQEQERSFKKPATFKFAKRNFPIGNVQINVAELSEVPRCECKADQEDPCSSDCLNRILMYECHPQVCPAKEKCNNQRFQKRQYPHCEPFKSEKRGWGLRAVQDLKKGQFVMEYVGDLIDEEECKKRIEIAHENNISNFYMLTMDKNRIIDAGPRGNNSRFMNHSCCPNLVTQKWMVNGDIRVGLFTLCDITKGSELTFNYNLECLGNEKTACACGADNCSGFLGVRPKTAAAIANEKKLKEIKKKKQKKKINQRKETEDECFRCGEGGELVMCDKGSCPKVYHLQCLKLTKPPTGKWMCPWHHCDDCGKLATSLCSECPNSFCAAHIEGNITTVAGCLICTDHDEEMEDELSPDVTTASADAQTLGTQAGGDNSEGDDNSSQDEASVQRVLFNDNADHSKTQKSGNTNGKKVAKRKSFKDLLSEASSPVKSKNASAKLKDISSKSSSVSQQKERKSKGLPNGDVMMNGHVGIGEDTSPVSVSSNGQGEKIGIFLKMTTVSVSSKKGGKVGHTKTRYKSQLLSSPNKYMLTGGGQDADNDSESDLVIDIPKV